MPVTPPARGWWVSPFARAGSHAVLYCTVLYCTVLYCTVLHCTCHTPPDSWPHCPGCGWSGSCLPAACCRIVLSSAPGETTGIFSSDWKYNHQSIQSFWWNTYYASSNPCVSFASSGCAPEINAEAEDNSSTPQLHENWKHIMVESVDFCKQLPADDQLL